MRCINNFKELLKLNIGDNVKSTYYSNEGANMKIKGFWHATGVKKPEIRSFSKCFDFICDVIKLENNYKGPSRSGVITDVAWDKTRKEDGNCYHYKFINTEV